MAPGTRTSTVVSSGVVTSAASGPLREDEHAIAVGPGLELDAVDADRCAGGRHALRLGLGSGWGLGVGSGRRGRWSFGGRRSRGRGRRSQGESRSRCRRWRERGRLGRDVERLRGRLAERRRGRARGRQEPERDARVGRLDAARGAAARPEVDHHAEEARVLTEPHARHLAAPDLEALPARGVRDAGQVEHEPPRRDRARRARSAVGSESVRSTMRVPGRSGAASTPSRRAPAAAPGSSSTAAASAAARPLPPNPTSQQRS